MMFALTTSTTLALAGTALFAIVIFAPRPRRETIPSAHAYAPPAPVPIERWTADAYASAPSDFPYYSGATAAHAADIAAAARSSDPSFADVASAFPSAAFDPPATSVITGPPADTASIPDWPQLIDARARALDAHTRAVLADALRAVDTPWSRTILARALAEEHDEDVRARLSSDRTGRPVHPTPAYADES